MTRVIVAAGINNELESRDIAAVRRLKQAGYDVQFYYYLPKVPVEFSMIPSFNSELKDWKSHAAHMLNELGNKLDIPKGNRHLVDEVLGPDRVFDEAREAQANVILTNKRRQLRQSTLSKLYDLIGGMFTGKTSPEEVPVEQLNKFVTKKLGTLKEAKKAGMAEAAVNDEKMAKQWRKGETQHKIKQIKPRTGTR